MTNSVGLELGTSIVRAARLQRAGARLRLVACAEVPWSGDSGDELTHAIAQVRKTLAIQQPVIVGIPTGSATVTTVQPLVVNRARSSLAVQFELQQQLLYNLDQAVWHYQWFGTNGAETGLLQSPGAASRAVVAAMKRSLFEERLHACQRAGVAVTAVTVTALAAVNLWVQRLERPGSLLGAFLHLDGPTLEWIVVTPQGLRIVPVFLSGVTSADPTLGDQVATLKASWASVQEQLATLVTPPGAAAGQTQAERLPKTVWMLGASAMSVQLTEILKRELACAVEVLNLAPTVIHQPASPLHPEHFAVACGLALQGLGMARLPVDLLTEIVRARRATRIRRSARTVGFLSAVLAVGFTARGMLAILNAHREALRRLTEQEQTYTRLRPEVRSQRERQAQLERRLGQLEQLAQARSLISQTFQHVTEVLPDAVWLTKLDLAKDGILEGLLEGYAKSFQGVTELMDHLKSAGWATVKPLATTVTTEPTTGKELVAFTVKIEQPLPGFSREPSEAPASKPAATVRPGSPKSTPARKNGQAR